MWTKGNYRRNLLDMHISDEKDGYLENLNIDEYISALKAANIQSVIVKAKPHTGLCYWPSSVGEMHRGLQGYDFFGEMVTRCHDNDIKVVAYYSQIYDNWAYEKHPAWRLVTPEGKGFQECDKGKRMHQTGRYGIMCPNNAEYRGYVKYNLEELNTRYSFEGMFLDMAFWPEVCYCDSCRERYLQETGHEIPRKIDWKDSLWLAFVDQRNEWMREFVAASTNTVKAIHPEVTIEHNFAMVMSTWRNGCTELLSDEMDFVSGDFYGGFLQQSFINKYYRSISKTLPFNYHTSRCSPSLEYHTTTKEPDELIRTAITALVHNGAFLNVDAVNPDGSIHPAVYHDTLKTVFERTSKYEKYVGGNLKADAAIWFDTKTKCGGGENGLDTADVAFGENLYYSSALGMTGILRQFSIPFDVVGSKNLSTLSAKTLIVSANPRIGEQEMTLLEHFVNEGGSLYVSGCIGHKRLEELLGVRCLGETLHNFTYIAPTAAGTSLFQGFEGNSPMTVPMSQQIVELVNPHCEILGTQVLPYTSPKSQSFASIHSNPPGEFTDRPAVIMKQVGKGKIFWIAAPIETSTPYQSRQAVQRILKLLSGGFRFCTNSPANVEVLEWEKENKRYFAVINQQEEPRCSPVYELFLEVPEQLKSASLVEENLPLTLEHTKSGTRILLPKLTDFLLFTAE